MRNINPFGLRMQPELRHKVEEAAKQNRRSLNAELIARIEASFNERGDSVNTDTVNASDLAQELAAMKSEIHELRKAVQDRNKNDLVA
ncbi:Arc-like DNA binding dprotein [Azomonas agilis]|uniref:Arc-like DNA binding dprotein n=1 Tax=Azomonas agilis TaxID=116849 RepID=A0A562HZA5_9GAMM|nr:Arc family DNA-binding protein [Azomonas agilis]TWH63818.1 Arc-like DNA binding dprotein [Azomonas agilis]